MKIPAALLLTILCSFLSTTRTSAALGSNSNPPNQLLREDSSASNDSSNVKYNASTSVPDGEDKKVILSEYVKPFGDIKHVLLQEIHTLGEDTNDSRLNDAVPSKAEVKPKKATSSLTKSIDVDAKEKINGTKTKDGVFKKLLEAEDMEYVENLHGRNPDDKSDKIDEAENTDSEYIDDYNEDDDIDDDPEEDDDDDNDDDDDDDDDDDNDTSINCPKHCKCIGHYIASVSATCTKLVEQLPSDPAIGGLRLENVREIRLGPHALKSRKLNFLGHLKIADTRIVYLDRTAFDGISSLFSVNLTRNALQGIHPQTFQNNSQLSLLTISGNPFKYGHILKGTKHYLFDAPSVTEFVFSNNGLPKLPRTAFQKMQNLEYVNLSGNRLKEVEKAHFDPLNDLLEVDLSNNLLNEIPVNLFGENSLETLRLSGNNLSTLVNIKSSELTTLEAARNKIKVIAKDDLSGVPFLDQFIVSSNGMKRIHQHAFMNLDQLTYLDVSDNKLTSWSEHHLKNNPRLQVLLMNDNPDLGSLPVFRTADSEYNTYSTYRFECSNCGLERLEPQTFDDMPALTKLNLSKNRLTGLPNDLFKFLFSLQELDLSENLIENLDQYMFRGAVTLMRINLSGNPLVTLQVAPFLLTPSLNKLDVSRCELERVWSEARVPLQKLRFLSVSGNLLRRITLEELKAMPKLSALDLSHNPLDCDEDFNSAVEWLTSHGITPIEIRTHSTYGDNMDYSDAEGITQWKDLAKIVCDGVEDGPPSRTIPTPIKSKAIFPKLLGDMENTNSLLSGDLEDNEDLKAFDHFTQSDEEDRSWEENQYTEYGDYAIESSSYRPWYSNALWPILTVIVVTIVILLLIAHVAITVAKRRGRSPVIRPPMILRQGLVDNKNCGLVYKPLQEEIATPHMPKRGSFYSSSTFHYDKIVPESV